MLSSIHPISSSAREMLSVEMHRLSVHKKRYLVHIWPVGNPRENNHGNLWLKRRETRHDCGDKLCVIVRPFEYCSTC